MSASSTLLPPGEVHVHEATPNVGAAHFLTVIRRGLAGHSISSLRRLEVEFDGGRGELTITGSTRSYYHKQVAQHAVISQLPSDVRLVNQIEVEKNDAGM